MKWKKELFFPRLESPLVVAAAVAAYVLFYFFFGEKTPQFDGLGAWDGYIYGSWVKDFYGEIVVKRVGPYYIQRVLPSSLVYFFMKALGVQRTSLNIAQGFRILNGAALCGTAYLWVGITERQGIGRAGKYLGLIALLVNYQVHFFAFYYSVLTDTSSYFLSILMLHFYLRGRTLGLAVTGALSGLVFPSSPYIALCLLCFPYRKKISGRGLGNWARYTIPAFFCLPVVGAVALYHRQAAPWLPPSDTLPIQALGLLLTIAYLWFAFRALTSEGALAVESLPTDRKSWLRVFAILAGYLAYKEVLGILGGPRGMAIGASHLSGAVARAVISLPLAYLFLRLIFFGPLLVITIFYWRRICSHLRELGFGIWCVLVLGIGLSLLGEARGWVNFFPFFVFVTCFSFRSAVVSRWELFGFLSLSYFLGRSWESVAAPTPLGISFFAYRNWLLIALFTFAYLALRPMVLQRSVKTARA